MGLGDLGDTATQDAVIHHLMRRDPGVAILLFSNRGFESPWEIDVAEYLGKRIKSI